ncbi:YihY/virulence factor BrkB family protein [Arsenicicoccus piscis]|uniref:Uncharacterized protein n=1 Tax=Arsenicicoccus piscis TaxID=673954 RepID=A0ABQ6HK58_9MICO|nr:YihY/virulence factor BrkB family protein [Arsenicicoccus piscis]MCH8627282.1 YihY/virulence factor BrkB family protein [Arsenicicoccus piscis]GMA18732.1 hypothetical protein GCM10025862_07530 [Arsenicicoccus piscis]
MSIVDRVDQFQRRHPVVGFPLAVLYKFFDDQGPYLTALITYYGFLSIFPMLLLFSSVLGFVLQSRPDWQERLIDSAANQIPIIGEELKNATLQGNTTAIVIGGLVALYGSLGIAQAIQNAMNVCWAVPRNQRPNPFLARARSTLMILTAGLLVLVTTIAAGAGTLAGDAGIDLGAFGTYLVPAITIALNAAVFMLLYRISTAHPMRRRQAWPGAIFMALWLFAVQTYGTGYIGRVRTSSQTYGTFAIVLALLAWAYVAALGLVLSVELNVVAAKKLYPRALLTVFTDNVDLTRADKKMYEGMVNANRLKGFQQVEVSFERNRKDLEAKAAAEDAQRAEGAQRSDGAQQPEGAAREP